MAAIQFAAIQQVWQDAVANVPFYAKFVDATDVPAQIDSFETFTKCIPVTTRSELKKKPADLVRRYAPDKWSATSGSTGDPFTFGLFRDEGTINAINQTLGKIDSGMEIQDRLFWVWGHVYTLGTGWAGKLRYIERWIKDICFGYVRVSAYRLDAQSLGHYVDFMNRVRPQVVLGY